MTDHYHEQDDEQSYESDSDYEDDDEDVDIEFDNDNDHHNDNDNNNNNYLTRSRGSKSSSSSSNSNEMKQHLIAILIAIVAAIATHAKIHGGFSGWKNELTNEFQRVFQLGETTAPRVAKDHGSKSSSAPHAAPSMDAIPTLQRQQVLDRAGFQNNRNKNNNNNKNHDGGMHDTSFHSNEAEEFMMGHEQARNYRRTSSLQFCPTNDLSAAGFASPNFHKKESSHSNNNNNNNNNNNLIDLEFILPLSPSLKVLHVHYLSDALGLDSSTMVYDGDTTTNINHHNHVHVHLGSYEHDSILTEIDNALLHLASSQQETTDVVAPMNNDKRIANNNNNNNNLSSEGLSLDQLESILKKYLPPPLTIDPQHLCLLQQYTLNKASGRSIRGVTKVYDRPHVSTFYRGKFPTTTGGTTTIVEPNYKIPPASLTFTGFATKFINLSPNTPINLYWDGGRIPSGPREGQMHSVLVGTIDPMESLGTASFPGHAFYVTPLYDKEHILQRWTVTEDEPILYHDPLLEDLGSAGKEEEMQKWGAEERMKREEWMVNKSFARDYLIKTGRAWLANFPQVHLENHHFLTGEELFVDGGDVSLTNNKKQGVNMWRADYIGQSHTLQTSHLYFTSLPATLPMLTKEDYLPEIDIQRRLELKQQFQSGTLKATKKKNVPSNTNDVAVDVDAPTSINANMSLTLKVLSVVPRVLEVKKFLSPLEVQHLINLASGATGQVSMERSSVLASGGNKKKVRGTSKTDTRSSTGGWIHREQDVVVDTIFRRVADLLNIDESLMRDQRPPHLMGHAKHDTNDASAANGDDGKEPLPTHDRIVEAMQLLRYGPGEEYIPHHDFTYPSVGNRYQPKRYATILLYLTGEGDVIDDDGIRHSSSSLQKNEGQQDGNIPLQGGETTFPRSVTTQYHDGVKISPQSGKAVLFYNVLPDGNMDDLSQHSGGKVEKGVKYLANIWVWDPIIN